MANTPLFDNDVERLPPPKQPTESAFQFLNRADGAPWDSLRDLLETWYRDYPDPDDDLRNRFRSDLRSQHIAAWWELYVFALFRRLGYDVTPHPDMPARRRSQTFWSCVMALRPSSNAPPCSTRPNGSTPMVSRGYLSASTMRRVPRFV